MANLTYILNHSRALRHVRLDIWLNEERVRDMNRLLEDVKRVLLPLKDTATRLESLVFDRDYETDERNYDPDKSLIQYKEESDRAPGRSGRRSKRYRSISASERRS